MKNVFKKFIVKSCRDESGTALIDYAMILSVIVAAAAVGIFFLGKQGDETFRAVQKATAKANRIHSVSTAQSASSPANTTSDNETEEQEVSSVYSAQFKQRIMFISLTVCLIAMVGYAIRLRSSLKTHKDYHRITVSPESLHAAEQRKFDKRQMILQTLENQLYSLFNNEMLVRQLMTQPVNYVLPSSRVSDVRRLMKQDNVRHYPVCDKTGRLVGILSDRDVLLGEGKYVSECMTRDVLTVSSDSKVSPAITLMMNEGISSLPIVDGGKLVGLLTTTDLVMTFQCALQILHKSDTCHDLQQSHEPQASIPVKFQAPVLKG